MQVKATKVGFIYGLLRKVGDKFTLIDSENSKAKEQFSSNWMEEIKQPIKAKAKTRTKKSSV